MTADRLRDAGFVDIATEVVEAPTQMESESAYREFLTNVIFGQHLARLPGSLRPAFIDHLVAGAALENPAFLFDYWRLNMRAKRPH